MCDLVTDHHADAPVVERFSLAFTEERGLEDPCGEHWHQGYKLVTEILKIFNDLLHPCLTVFAYTYLVFAGWVERVDNGSSSDPPGEDKEGGIKDW